MPFPPARGLGLDVPIPSRSLHPDVFLGKTSRNKMRSRVTEFPKDFRYWWNARKLKRKYWSRTQGFVQVKAARRYSMWHRLSVEARMKKSTAQTVAGKSG